MLYVNPCPVLSALLLPKIFLIDSQDERKYLPYPLYIGDVCSFFALDAMVSKSAKNAERSHLSALFCCPVTA